VTSTLRGVRSPVRSARYGRAANDVGRPWRARGRSELTRQMSVVRTQSHPPAPGHIFGCAHTIRPRRRGQVVGGAFDTWATAMQSRPW
jgi:hypothetical protein